jgi:hypothetical protein
VQNYLAFFSPPQLQEFQEILIFMAEVKKWEKKGCWNDKAIITILNQNMT